MCKRYVNDTLIGIGALKGAPCEVDAIDKVDGVTTVTLKWEDTSGGIHNESFDIIDGTTITDASINSSGNLIIELSDGTEIDCGKVNSQFTVLPSPSADNLGVILQYVGNTTLDHTKGYFYECVLDGGTYKWIQKNVQPGGGGGGDIQVTDFPPASFEELGNIYQYVGLTTLKFTTGCFYRCIYDDETGTYDWEPISVEDPDTYEDDPIDFSHDW